MPDSSLTSLDETSPDLIVRLSALGITTVEQLAFVAAAPRRANLLEALAYDEARFAAAVPDAMISPSTGEAPADDDPRSLGVLDLTPEISDALARQAAPAPIGNGVGLPSSINHVQGLPPVRDQGHRGTCVAFALSAVHEFQARQQGPVDFSEQFLYEEVKRIDGSAGSCGTWQIRAVRVIQDLGQCLEADWPYNGDLPCNGNGVEPADARKKAAAYKATPMVFAANDVAAAKTCLSQGHLVGVSIPVWDSWYQSGSPTHRTGVITMRLGSEPRRGGHAICIVGYEDDPAQPGGGVFIIRNSWGSGWAWQCRFGGGYGTLPYAYVANDATELITLN